MQFKLREALLLGASFVAAFAFSDGANAKPKYQVLYTFGKDGSTVDGAQPIVGLTGDGRGNLYGITNNNGVTGAGTIFKMSGGTFQVLYSINCDRGGACPDGALAGGEVVVDTSGNLYGTMQIGGANGGGTLFELTTDGHYNVLYNFCNAQACTDGASPYTPLTYVGANGGALYDGKSPLYGATINGGLYNDGGLAFTFTPGKGEKSLYSFCKQPTGTCKGGAHPFGSVSVDSAGTFYGTDNTGAKQGFGSVWSAHPAGQLHSFCDATCKSGSNALGVFLDPSAPTLYGSTIYGGKPGHGVAYSYDLSAQTYTVLHSFCTHFIEGQGCDDGDLGSSALYPDSSGGVIGTTLHGGITDQTYGDGLLYRIDLATKKFSPLFRFCSIDQLHCTDGRQPLGQLVQYGGKIYGVTEIGGAADYCNGFGCGVIYQVTP